MISYVAAQRRMPIRGNTSPVAYSRRFPLLYKTPYGSLSIVLLDNHRFLAHSLLGKEFFYAIEHFFEAA